MITKGQSLVERHYGVVRRKYMRSIYKRAVLSLRVSSEEQLYNFSLKT